MSLNPILKTIEESAEAAKTNWLPTGLVSADSHVTEPPHCYEKYIDPKFRARSPRMIEDPQRGSCYVLDGMDAKIPMAVISSAGLAPQDIQHHGRKFEDLHRGGWDGKARIADQDRDGIAAEVIYPSVGMVLCNHPDADYQHAAMWAYNRWLAEEFCAAAPERIIGLGQTAVRSVDEAIADVRKFKEMGFKGVMLPGVPNTAFDYDHVNFDHLWEAVVDLNLPISFHISTTRSDQGRSVIAQGVGNDRETRGHLFNRGNLLLKTLQDIIGMFIWGGVFERHGRLKLVITEGDAGWAPHWIYRNEHAYQRHRFWAKVREMEQSPAHYFHENVYLTFQDDWTALRVTDMLNPRRLLWANDFPHSDSTWPWSRDLLAGQTTKLSDQEKCWILRDNAAEIYGIKVPVG